MTVTLHYDVPSADEYNDLRIAVGWDLSTPEIITLALQNSLFTVTLRQAGQLVGMARVVGDGGLAFYVQDVIVLEHLRGQGYGKLLMDEVMKYLHATAKPGSGIGLMAALGKEAFYEPFGFHRRPNTLRGSGMSQHPSKW
ncbi:GNAT family N-acetyltransferase [Acerihabitans sp. TG2]|uniref:GNAT family N-acetyltransferase n=1 Tax=Acerihabitans sp. TG2 TaxID=3096008 RepID=UPI002B22A9CE|nr:GNAT family N-acetyltransferase [Acerihabitans sp. TG2]MEA9389568.1 GNAT family N-acetyltransferase [Acerihabitans sp. TG2]